MGKVMLFNEADYQKYLASDVWKCDKSPTGAHFWIDTHETKGDMGLFVCKYCGDVGWNLVYFNSRIFYGIGASEELEAVEI